MRASLLDRYSTDAQDSCRPDHASAPGRRAVITVIERAKASTTADGESIFHLSVLSLNLLLSLTVSHLVCSAPSGPFGPLVGHDVLSYAVRDSTAYQIPKGQIADLICGYRVHNHQAVRTQSTCSYSSHPVEGAEGLERE